MTATTRPLPFFVLGAADPEMAAIEGLLAQAGVQFDFAATAGRRVTPATAYEADGVSEAVPAECRLPVYGCMACGLAHLGEECCTGPTSAHVRGEEPPRGTVLVECGGPVEVLVWVVARCDHHRPGDPGYGRKPGDFLAGSSIGQVIAILARHGALRGRCGVEAGEGFGPGPVGSVVSPRPSGSFVYSPAQGEWRVVGPHTMEVAGKPHGYLVPVDRGLVLVAALDHCPAAACRGECPGVNPDEARAEFARRSGCPPEEVAEAQAALLAAPAWGDQPHVRDLSARPAPPTETGQRCDRGALPGLRVAMMVTGLAVLARVRMPDGREKLVLQGAGAGTLAGEEPVRRFIALAHAGAVPAARGDIAVAGPYGNPVRGYAGAEVTRG